MRLSGLDIVFQNNESVNNDPVHSCLRLLKNKPQINADERRFVNLNLFNMIRCAEVFPDDEIVHALSGQLSWAHFREIIYLENNMTVVYKKHD